MTNAARPTDDDLLALFEGALADDAASHLLDRIKDDPEAQAQLAAWAAQNDALAALYPVQSPEAVPARLTNIIRDARTKPATTTPWLRIAAMVGFLAIGIGGGWALRGAVATDPTIESLATLARSVHQTYVAEVRHPVEVLASDAEHLNTWMSKRIGRDVRPPDLAAIGFTLLGGRVVPGAGGGVAGMYMYEDAQGRRVTLYMQPEALQAATSFQFAQDGAMQS
jgi:anti-sigma factor RsiW